MVEALAPLIFLVIVYRLATGRKPMRGRPSWRRVGNSLTDTGSGEPGLLLTAIACAEMTWFVEIRDFGAALFVLAACMVGFHFFHSVTTTFIGVVGSMFTVNTLLSDPACVADHGQLQVVFVVVVAGALLIAVGSVRLLGAIVSAKRSIGRWALGAFAALQLIAAVLHPGGYALLEVAPNAPVVVVAFVLLGIVIAGIALAPDFTASAAGIGVLVAEIFIDTVSYQCGASFGVMLFFVLAAAAFSSIMRRWF